MSVVLAATSAYITSKTRQVATVAASAIVLATCAFLGVWIATSRIYQPQLQLRFGMGVSRVMFPVGPAEWLNENAPKGRIWTDFISSSNLYFLLEPTRELPLITNGWAYPPAVMEEVIDVYRNTATRSAVDNLNAAADTYGMTTLLVRTDRGMQVWSQLAGSTEWSLVYLDGAYAILMRRTGADAELARQAQIRSADWDADAYIAHAKRVEFRPAHALDAVGRSISAWGWDDQAIRLLTEAVAADPRSEIAWRSLGLAQATRAMHRHERRDRGAIDDFTSAVGSLDRSLELEPDPRVAQARKRVAQQIDQMRILYPTPHTP